MDILRITDPIPKHYSIDEYEHFENESITGCNINNLSGSASRLKIFFPHPCESYLLIERRLTKANGTNADNVSDVSF